MISITIVIVVITCIISFLAFSNNTITDNLIFYPPAIANRRQWYRFFSCGLIHADIAHLAFNMISLYLFGRLVEAVFIQIFGTSGALLYALMYVTALGACLLPTYEAQKNNYHYRSLGASGAVSAVVFAGIFLFPTQEIGFMFIPPIIPGFIFGPIYLFISVYMSEKGHDNINHSAHFWGAIYGIAFLIAVSFALSDFNPFYNFVNQIKSYF